MRNIFRSLAALSRADRKALPGGKRRYALIAWLILACGGAITVGATVTAQRMLMSDAEVAFKADARDLAGRIQEEVRAYEEVLIGLSAFMRSREQVSRVEFKRYVDGINLARRFPGFQNLSYAEQLSNDELPAFLKRVRSDNSIQLPSDKPFAIWPPGARESYHVIVHIEPLEKNLAFVGRDAAARPEVAKAAARVRDTGELTTSGIPVRVAGPDGFVALTMRVAVYRPGMPLDTVYARREAYRGSVGAGYRIRDLVKSVLKESDRFQALTFSLADAGPSDANWDVGSGSGGSLFEKEELSGKVAATREASFTAAIDFPVGGRRWEVKVSTPKRIDGAFNRLFPSVILAGGGVTTLLLFGLFGSLATSRSRAEELARGITRELRESEQNLSEAQRMAKLGNWWLEVESGRMAWSEEALRLLGCERETAPGDFPGLLAVVHPDNRDLLRSRLAAARLEGHGYDVELRLLRQDGGTRWVHALGQSTRDDTGRILTVRGTFMDITPRKVLDRRTELEVVLSRLLSGSRPTGSALQEVLLTACETYGWGAARIWEQHTGGAALRRVAAQGSLSIPGEAAIEALLCDGLNGAAPLDRQNAVWFGADCDRVELPAALRDDFSCGLVLPVAIDGETCDLLAFFSRGPNCGDDEALQAMTVVAAQLGHFLQRRHAEENLQYVATHDALTGLPNRREFNNSLGNALVAAEREQHRVAVLYVDLDRFKNINDALGHSAGDEVLRTCARRFREALRDSDLVAQISGDEFSVLLEHCPDPAAATAVARKLLDAAAAPMVVQGQEISVSASVGISLYPEDGLHAEALVKNADIAMFRAKENGRNGYQFYSTNINTHTAERLAMESKLRRALERDELRLHYQPKVDVRTRQITGFEALLRWQHPELGLVPPLQFIPIAEETGLIVPIGAWVMKEACRQAKRWQEQGLPPVRVAVNLSARQFRHHGLKRDVVHALSDSALDARFLELEITESMVMHEPEQATALLEDLKAIGLGLSIDDFGTGYSSLSYLKRFPIDCIKIDRSFIKDIPQDADDLAITEAVVAMAHGLRLNVVAEGVETVEQLEWLRRFGCDEIQGYYFSKPLPADEAARLLSTGFRKEKSGGRSRRVVTSTATSAIELRRASTTK